MNATSVTCQLKQVNVPKSKAGIGDSMQNDSALVLCREINVTVVTRKGQLTPWYLVGDHTDERCILR